MFSTTCTTWSRISDRSCNTVVEGEAQGRKGLIHDLLYFKADGSRPFELLMKVW